MTTTTVYSETNLDLDVYSRQYCHSSSKIIVLKPAVKKCKPNVELHIIILCLRYKSDIKNKSMWGKILCLKVLVQVNCKNERKFLIKREKKRKKSCNLILKDW